MGTQGYQLGVLGVVVVATVAAYQPSIDGAFVFDDIDLISDPHVVGPFTLDASTWRASARPLTTMTFALNHLAGGLESRGWHVTNLAIHVSAVLLAWLLARITLTRAGLSRPDGPALAVAGVFALHPLQTEAVSYVTQRAESLASALYLAALIVLLLRDEARGAHRHALLGLALALHVLGLAAKPIVATLPATWILHSAVLSTSAEATIPAWRRAWRRVPAALPLFGASCWAAFEGIRETARSAHAGFDVPGVSPSLYLATQLRAIPTYLRLVAWPVGQCADWQFAMSDTFVDASVLGGGALLAAIAAAAIAAGVRFRDAAGDASAAARTATFGVLFFLLALTPSSSVIPLRDAFAEHRVYLASLGLALAASASATAALRNVAPSRAAVIGAALTFAVLAALGYATARRNEVWATAVAFWRDTAEKAPRKARVLLNLGKALYEADRPADALTWFQKAHALAQDATVSRQDVQQAIVETLLTLGRSDDARVEVERALAERPRDPASLTLLSRIEFVDNRDAESERAALAALALEPGKPAALHSLGEVRLRLGNVRGARAALRAAAATFSVDPLLYRQLGEAEERSGAMAAACAAYARAAALPGNALASAEARTASARVRCP